MENNLEFMTVYRLYNENYVKCFIGNKEMCAVMKYLPCNHHHPSIENSALLDPILLI